MVLIMKCNIFSARTHSRPIKILKCMKLHVILILSVAFVYLLFLQEKEKSLKCLSFEEMVLKKIGMEDKCLVNDILKSKLLLPSKLPYNLTTKTEYYNQIVNGSNAVESLLKDKDAPWVEALIAVETLVPKQGQRYFLECGALDGVTFSTTLHLERFLNWTGVLIEADSRFYLDMKHTHRKSYAVHACASRDTHPTFALFETSPIYYPIKVNGSEITIINPGTGGIQNDQRRWQPQVKGDLIKMQCVPVYSILLAVNMTRIDLFVLDVEGVEMDILKTIPFEKVDIAVFMVEVNGKSESEREKIHKFLKSKEYTFYDNFKGGMHPGDDIFIKKKYLKNRNHWKKLEETNIKEIYKIITGRKEEDISKSDVLLFANQFLPLFG